MKYILYAAAFLYFVYYAMTNFSLERLEESEEESPSNYVHSFAFDVTVPGDSLSVYRTFAGDVTPWWDHYFSPEKPYKMFIEAKPGGGFYEYFDAEGNGVKHAEVTIALPGKLLRMEGPLGLTGQAMHGVYSLEFSGKGTDSTKIAFSTNLSGQIDKNVGNIVEQVWRHFLISRFKPFVEGRLK